MVQNQGVLLTNVTRTSKGDLISFRILAADFLIASPPKSEEVIRVNDEVVGVAADFVVSAPGGGKSLAKIKVIFSPEAELFFLDHWVEI